MRLASSGLLPVAAMFDDRAKSTSSAFSQYQRWNSADDSFVESAGRPATPKPYDRTRDQALNEASVPPCGCLSHGHG
jgi:hypothetical protein